jgi:predicted TIM-barrel fold metal-dependent hydrolase
MSATASGTKVDSHALIGQGITWNGPQREATYDPTELGERAAQSGIDKICVISPRGNDYPSANRSLSRICQQGHSEFIGFAVHNPASEAGSISKTLTEEVRSMGLRGVRSDGHPTRELLDAAAELRIPVIYYPQPSGRATGQSAVAPARWYHIIASSYPQVNFILPHLGSYCSQLWWGHMEAIDLAKRYENVYVDTSGIGNIKYLAMAAKELPPEKILFASFAPELDPRVGAETVRLMNFSPEALTKVMGGNMSRLLPQAA